MAQQLPCDYCGAEEAALMMNSLTDGSVVTVGAACLPLFFAGALHGSIGVGGHAGPPTKCQTCRTIHQMMDGATVPASTSLEAGTDENPVTGDLEPSGEPS